MLKLQESQANPARTTARVPPTVAWSNVLMTIRMLGLVASGAMAAFQMLSRGQIDDLWVWLQSDDGAQWGVTVLTYATPVLLGGYALVRNTKLYQWMHGLVQDPRVKADVIEINGGQ